MYVSSSNPITPDIFQLADQNKGLDEKARAQASTPLNASITGELASPYPRLDKLPFELKSHSG